MTSIVANVQTVRRDASAASISTAIAQTMQQWYARIQHRHQMAELTTAQMNDMGVNVNQVYAEISKPFWR